MRLDGRRRGSALLIVLGMLAFMIVSAVAFSAYMRVSRLPSSYLRRTSATRQLVKAGLARAIDEIDAAVANNPHPGIGTESVQGHNKNIWKSRVYIGTNRLYNAAEAISETIPVLTLEGLAYIPPALVNDARFFSRRSQAARWKSFGFDSGRYAFCAIDVSDYLDVNRLAADLPRSSAANGRISLAYLFEPYGHRSSGNGASDWDSWMLNFRDEDEDTLGFKYDSKVPLVSIADLNLALGENGKGGFHSPFCKFINSSDDSGFSVFGGQAEEEQVRKMTFVTDSWFPEHKAKSEDDQLDDLGDPANQPFPMQILGVSGAPRPAMPIQAITSSVQAPFEGVLPGLGFVSLFDYLDGDSVPSSLACPTVERTPMICGLKPNGNVKLQLALNSELASTVTDAAGNKLPDTKQGETRDAYVTYEYNFSSEFMQSLGSLYVDVLLAYPFAHADGVKETSFKVDGRATLFLSVDGDPMKLRTRAKDDLLRPKNKGTFATDKGIDGDKCKIVVPFKAIPKDFRVESGGSSIEERQKKALYDDLHLKTNVMGIQPADPVVRIKYHWTQKWTSNGMGGGSYQPAEKPGDADIAEAHCGFYPLASNGSKDAAFTSDASFADIVSGKNAGKSTVSLKMALSVRVTDSKDKTVDLVPADFYADSTFLGVNNDMTAVLYGGKGGPLMLFDLPSKINFADLSSSSTAQSASPSPEAVRIDDPRYNYAPENWYVGDITKESWLKDCGAEAADGDIFMATSDQGYLQSICELAFLPRLGSLVSTTAKIAGDLANPDVERETFGGKADVVNAGSMWRTYRLFGENADDFDGLGFTSAGSGFKVNPYTDSTNIMMAAFANTPVDWRMASTNNLEIEELGADEFNKKYAWNDYGASDSKISYADLEGIAGAFMFSISDRTGDDSLTTVNERTLRSNWQTAWRNLWSDSGYNWIGDVDLQNNAVLTSADRKFLYGYWKDCFGVNQQLFLVFVRAEPLMMGGGAISSIPPQLGARAVALVWRDPSATPESASASGKTGYPHRTRVLFYKQLD